MTEPERTPSSDSALLSAWPCGSCGQGYMACYDGWIDTGRACCPRCDAHSASQRQTDVYEDWPQRAARGERFPSEKASARSQGVLNRPEPCDGRCDDGRQVCALWHGTTT